MSQNNEKAPFTIQVTRKGMGNADGVLDMQLIKKYFALLAESNYLPSVISFYTDGVKLVVKGSPVIEELKKLEEKGVRLVLCATCLNHFGLSDQVEVGIVGGMTDIIEAQWKAEKVITL